MVKGVGHLAMLKLWSAGGREFKLQPGHYSRMVRFSHLNNMVFPNSEFI